MLLETLPGLAKQLELHWRGGGKERAYSPCLF